MDVTSKSRSRRAEVRKNRPDTGRFGWQHLKAAGVLPSVGIAAAFFAVTSLILLLRQDVVPYRPDQPIDHDIVSRVAFTYHDKNRLLDAQRRAAEREPRVYAPNPDGDPWAALERDLLTLPERASASTTDVSPGLKELFDPGSLTALRNAAAQDNGAAYTASVTQFVKKLREYRNPQTKAPLVILDDGQRIEDLKARRPIRIEQEQEPVYADRTFAVGGKDELRVVVDDAAMQTGAFPLTLKSKIVDYTLAKLQPTHVLDEQATTLRRNEAANGVSPREGERRFHDNALLVRKTPKLSEADWQILRAENQAYVAGLKGAAWKPKLGVACLALIVTVALSAYVAFFQPRVVKNHLRGAAIAGLLVSMLLLAALAGIGNGPLFLLGTAPTLLVAMILTIAYDQRFSVGVASIHGLLATVALNQGVTFFIVLWVGVLAAAFLLTDIRTRSKLIEVGGACALAMMAASAAAGLLELESPYFILKNCLYSGAAGLGVGFIVLGILPFVERMFRITTSMTLLELADVSQPLLRRLAIEAPGTYSHSLQVAVLAEAAAEAIGVNSLACRVGAYYHDVGKIHKAEYFVENQTGGESRHLNLTPNVSYLIITSHVKDGVELAREYNLPTSLIPFIQQHHGTTVVEYFYRQACARQTQCDPTSPIPADHEYRYPGPKPRSKEVAIVMIADSVESATRAMKEPTAGRVEDLVQELTMKRLKDGQFDECDLTIRDLDRIKKALVRTLMSIYHGRIAYPSTSGLTEAQPAAPATGGAALAPVQSA